MGGKSNKICVISWSNDKNHSIMKNENLFVDIHNESGEIERESVVADAWNGNKSYSESMHQPVVDPHEEADIIRHRFLRGLHNFSKAFIRVSAVFEDFQVNICPILAQHWVDCERKHFISSLIMYLTSINYFIMGTNYILDSIITWPALHPDNDGLNRNKNLVHSIDLPTIWIRHCILR